MSQAAAPVTLLTLEQLVYGRRRTEAAQLLLRLLNEIDQHGGSLRAVGGVELDEHEQAQVINRIAAAATALLADPELGFSQSAYELFSCYKRFLAALFMASGFGSMNHLIDLAGSYDGTGHINITNDSMLRKLAFSLNPAAPIERYNLPELFKKIPVEVAIPLWLSFVDAEIVLGEQENRNRAQVAMLFDRLPEDYLIPDALLARVSNAWMFTSYMDFPEKHQPKKYLNKLLRRYGEKKGIREPRLPAVRKKPSSKPRLLVLSEHFTRRHAMYRCYRKAIESLREHFHTTCLCIDTTVDEESAKSFDEVITFKADEPLRKIAGRIAKRQPDLIYYPSLGMQNWTVVMAQFRFAPVQFMTMGHPATSMSPAIDYGLMREADPALHSEKLVCGFKVNHVPYNGEFDFTKLESDKDGVLIGVNAKNYKINYRLIQACKQIHQQAEVPVHFWFFPNCRGISLEAFRQELRRHLEAEAFPTTDYRTYIDRLRRCDVVLNPFPFGNTNGIIDCAHIGLPFVCMNGPELHSRVDPILSEQLGYPAFCRAETLDEYIEAAVCLVNDSNLRHKIQQEVLSEKRVERIFDDSVKETDILFGDSVHDLYQQHESLQNEDQRRFDVRELSALATLAKGG